MQRVRIVLVRPQVSGNVGSVARLCANFAVRELYLVAPECDPFAPEACMFGRGPARALLDGAKVVSSLSEALSGCTTAIGWSRRDGELRENSVSLGKSFDLLQRVDRMALVFGCESDGLTTSELLHCQYVSSICTDCYMPSMNLSHAVAVVLSRLFEDISERTNPLSGTSLSDPQITEENILATCAEQDALFVHFRQTMLDAAITDSGNPERMLAWISRSLQRAQLTCREVQWYRGFLSKIQIAIGTKNQRPRSS